MTRLARAASVAWLALACACAREAAPDGSTAMPASDAVSANADEPHPAPPEGWREFARGRIRFTAPADLVERELQGIDSLVGSYESAAFRVDFDFGWYSDDSFGGRYDGRTMRDGTLETTTVGGRPARLAAWSASNDAAGFTHGLGLYVPDVDRRDDAGDAPGETKLAFNVVYRDPADADRARRIATSVVIAPPTH